MPNQDPPRNREAELLPDPFWAADLASLRGQDFALYWYRWQLGLTILAALFGTLPAHRVGGVNIAPVASLLLLAAAGATAWLLHRRAPQEQWYEGRSTAESVKALTWKYVVRAQPFEGEGRDAEADKRFNDLVGRLPYSAQDGPAPGAGTQVNAEMQAARAGTLRERRNLYVNERLRAQKVWYDSRANECDQKVQLWGVGLAVVFSAGLLIAALEATTFTSLHALGVIPACAAAATAWIQLRQYRPLAASYRLAAKELDRIAAGLSHLRPEAPGAETEWSHLAREAEDAISREHIVWRARSQHRV
ncbi:DUF4231 domain-containing protein [Streptacidiphilus carbonis]|jgi:hypothetical protein|uniref:DUF4231 domain-containing protein n=1 Tax=Streptacidiphilus carbonis TaxID=105422 RepID=UPI0005A604C7|nr:DUF4231 domain-containing protein [Streptacidiphilus carbonis]